MKNERKGLVMLRHFRGHALVPTELSWEEKNPTNYIYRESEAIFSLRKRLAKYKNKEDERLKIKYRE